MKILKDFTMNYYNIQYKLCHFNLYRMMFENALRMHLNNQCIMTSHFSESLDTCVASQMETMIRYNVFNKLLPMDSVFASILKQLRLLRIRLLLRSKILKVSTHCSATTQRKCFIILAITGHVKWKQKKFMI